MSAIREQESRERLTAGEVRLAAQLMPMLLVSACPSRTGACPSRLRYCCPG